MYRHEPRHKGYYHIEEDREESGIMKYETDDDDLEHFSIMRYAGKELVSRGQNIGQPFPAYAWQYLLDKALINLANPSFRNSVQLMYLRAMDDAHEDDYVPSILEISDRIDEYNMIVIQDFYKNNGYNADEIDIIHGNYIQEFSCIMEDWVEDVLRNLGYSYCGSSVKNTRDIIEEQGAQTILFIEFLR